MKNSVTILSGPVHSGKTTRLSNWLTNKNAAGILAPVIEGRRYLQDIVTREKLLLESKGPSDLINATSIGEYFFDNLVFDWGCKIISDAIIRNYDWLVIDEFGPLELNGKGLAPAIDKIFSDNLIIHNTKILVVIRKNLVNDFFNHYELSKTFISDFDFLI